MNKEMICVGCGTQFRCCNSLPEFCPICSDDRQYVPSGIQRWTTHEELANNHRNLIREIDAGLFELTLKPQFAIGQRALLVVAPGGNILWDCIPLLDKLTIEFIRSKGGIRSIAVSHPHFYSNMDEWAEVFGCRIHIHESDKEWVTSESDNISFWNGREMGLWNGMRIINVGGHFPGSSILHVPFLSTKGVVLCGDTFVVSPSKRHIAAMYSYPNKIPLPLSEVTRIRGQMQSLEFDTIHAWIDNQSIIGNAKLILEKSLAKYV